MEYLEFLFKYSEQIRNLGLVLTALFGFPLILWRTSIANRQAITGEANHISDMFNKSIEQLGANNEGKPSIERRIGAIFALEKIAINNQDYYPQIIDVLCAYVRLHAPYTVDIDKTEIQEDIQVACTVIGRCLPKKMKNQHIVNLSNTDLTGVDLTGANLEGAKLLRVNFTRAKLKGTNLIETDLGVSDLSSAELEEANLTKADLTAATLIGANLRKANFTKAQLIATQLNKADLTETNFTSAELVGAVFTSAIIQNTNFYNSNGQYEMFKKYSNKDLETLDLKNLNLRV